MRGGLAGRDSFAVTLTIPRSPFPKVCVVWATSLARVARCVQRFQARDDGHVDGATIEVTGTATRWAPWVFQGGAWHRAAARS